MVALALAMALSRLFFLSLILFLVLAHWMLAMAPVRALFLGLIFYLSPTAPCQTMLYWPHTRALVAYNGGTSGGHSAIGTLFLEPDFVPSHCTLDVGHWPCWDSFLGLDLVSLAHDPLSNYVVLAPYQCFGGL